METIEDFAMRIKATFEDIEQYNINKILYCENCNNDEKFDVLRETKDKLILLVDDIDRVLNGDM